MTDRELHDTYPHLRLLQEEYRRWLRWCRAEALVREMRTCQGCDTAAAVALVSERTGHAERTIWRALRRVRWLQTGRYRR